MYINVDQDAVIRTAFEVPALPQSAVRLASIVADDDIELYEVVEVIEYDPALTLKLLRVANSVFSSSSRQIGTVKDAVIRLGTGAVLGAGCILTGSIPVIEAWSGREVSRGIVPSWTVAVSATRVRSFAGGDFGP